MGGAAVGEADEGDDTLGGLFGTQPGSQTQARRDPNAVLLFMNQIVVKRQARKRHGLSRESIMELAANIKEEGRLIQALAVREIGGGKYELVEGERRYRACTLLHMEEVPCRILRGKWDSAAKAIAQLSANLQREGYHPLDLAEEFLRLQTTEDLTNKEIAKRLGISEQKVGKYVHLAKAPAHVREAVELGALPVSEYFDNREAFNEVLPEHVKIDVAQAKKSGLAKAGEEKKKKKRALAIPKIGIPRDTAVQALELVKKLAKRYRLSAPEVVGELTNKQLVQLLAEFVPQILRKL